MPTIRQMYSGIYNLYKTTYANGELFRNTATNAQKNNSTLWSSTTNLNSNYRDLLSTYNATKNTFNGEFSDTMSALKSSARAARNFDFNVGENSVTQTETTGEDGEKIISTKYSDKLTDALKSVENFLSDYNDAIDFFNDNSSVSKRVSRLATNFADTTYFSKNFAEIGVVTAKDGTMKIDEDKLVDSITKNPNKVSRIIGSLADRAERKISTATSMQQNLFPAARTMLGSSFANSSIYSGKGLLNATSYANIGNLLNFMF